MNPRRRYSAPRILVLALLLAPASAEAGILDALGNLWETGKEKVGGLFRSGKEAVGGLFGGGAAGGGKELEALMGQIEAAQESVAGKGDNVAEYLNRLGGRAPGEATRPFLRERMRDLETSQRTLGELYSRLGRAIEATGGAQELTTQERQRIGLIQRQQQILVATAQQLDHRSDRALAGQPVPPAEPLDLPDGPLPPEVDPTSSETGDRAEARPETAVTRPEPEEAPPAPPQPREEERRPEEASAREPAARTQADLETDTPEGVQSWGSYERMRREQEEAEEETIVKADSADAFGGAGSSQGKADDAAVSGGTAQSDLRDEEVATASDGSAGKPGDGTDVEEQSYGAAGRPGGTEEHPTPAGSGEEIGGATEGGGDGTVAVPSLTAQATAPRVFDAEDSEMGEWVDEWLQAAGLDEYGRWVSPAAITANGPSDTGGLPRRTWVVAVYGDQSFGTNMSLNSYIAARLQGENPAITKLTNPDGTPLGTQPGQTQGGPRSVPSSRSGGNASAGTGGVTAPRRQDAQYLKLRQALEGGDRSAVREAYGNYTSER